MIKALLILTLFLISSSSVWAGPGHDHGTPGDSAGGPLSEIVLTQAMMTNLGIKTAPASLQDMSEVVDVWANVEYFPERQAAITSSAQGNISEILIHPGEAVRKGQKIVSVQPRLIGNPPFSVTSPIDGFVTEQNVVLGQAVSPDQELVRIADISVVLVKGKLFENMLSNGVKEGQKITLTTPALPGEKFEGIIHHIDAALQAGSRTREIDCLVENPEGKLLANMQANLAVHVGEQRTALVVPQRAILGDTGNYFLYVQEGDHFYRRDLTLGKKFGQMREIIDGVLPDEQVVILGNYQLQFITPPKAAGADDGHGHDH